jgi:hypothetical protein
MTITANFVHGGHSYHFQLIYRTLFQVKVREVLEHQRSIVQVSISNIC